MEQNTIISDKDPSKVYEDNELDIDLIGITKTLWSDRLVIFKSIIICAVLGILVAILTPDEYTAKSILVPQLKTDSQSGLSGLAALAGINVGISQSSSEVSPLIYPLIIKSIPFQLDLLSTPLQFKNSPTPITYLEYITSERNNHSFIDALKKYTIGLPSLIIKAFRKDNYEFSKLKDESKIIHLSEMQKKGIYSLGPIINLGVNSKEGYLTLSVDMPEPLPAAQLAQRTEDLLQSYIIEFKIVKSKADLDFIQQRYDELKKEFAKAQEELAIRVDRNKNFTSGLSSVETDRMQAQYNLTFSVYQELAKQLEQAKIQVKKETPVFSVIEPVTIPSDKSKPNRPLILALWIVIGTLIGVGIIFGKKYAASALNEFKK